MKVHPHATRGHLFVGAGLVLLSLGSVAASHAWSAAWQPWLVFFFGVWGGVELGRYLEAHLAKKTIYGEDDG